MLNHWFSWGQRPPPLQSKGRRPSLLAPFIGRGAETSTISGHVYGRVNFEAAIRERCEILDAVVYAPQDVLLMQKHHRRIFTEVLDCFLYYFPTRVDVRFIDSGVGQFIKLSIGMLIVRVGRMPD